MITEEKYLEAQKIIDEYNNEQENKQYVNDSVCPKCGSEDVIWTCYCNVCQECM